MFSFNFKRFLQLRGLAIKKNKTSAAPESFSQIEHFSFKFTLKLNSPLLDSSVEKKSQNPLIRMILSSFFSLEHVFATPAGSSLTALSGLKGGFFIVDEQKRTPAFSKDVSYDTLNPMRHFSQDKTGLRGWRTETMQSARMGFTAWKS